MHTIQQKLLNLLNKGLKVNYNSGLRPLCRLIGIENPQSIKHHLDQLEKKRFISINKNSGDVSVLNPIKQKFNKIFDLPILGSASCSPEGLFVDENIEGYLKVSQGVIKEKTPKGYFAIRAVGNSMNLAKDLKGGTIENGDYVIVNSARMPKNGDYVLSIIDEAANIKRYYKDNIIKEIRLVSESTINFPPITLSENDLDEKSCFINGVVERVIKN